MSELTQEEREVLAQFFSEMDEGIMRQEEQTGEALAKMEDGYMPRLPCHHDG